MYSASHVLGREVKAHKKRVSIYIYIILSFIIIFIRVEVRHERAVRGVHTRVHERGRTWVGTRVARAGVRFDVSTLQSTSARTGQPAELRM